MLAGRARPRNWRGRWYEWEIILKVVALDSISRQRSVRAVGKWAQEHREELVRGLQPKRRRIPSAATLRRAVSKIAIEELKRPAVHIELSHDKSLKREGR